VQQNTTAPGGWFVQERLDTNPIVSPISVRFSLNEIGVGLIAYAYGRGNIRRFCKIDCGLSEGLITLVDSPSASLIGPLGIVAFLETNLAQYHTYQVSPVSPNANRSKTSGQINSRIFCPDQTEQAWIGKKIKSEGSGKVISRAQTLCS